jgi:hypothetical protein
LVTARDGRGSALGWRDERGWRATFYTTGMEHSPTSATGAGWELTPWHPVTASGVGGVGAGQRWLGNDSTGEAYFLLGPSVGFTKPPRTRKSPTSEGAGGRALARSVARVWWPDIDRLARYTVSTDRDVDVVRAGL